VFLGDIASVDQLDVATTGYARTNGQPALTLTVTKTSAANTVQVDVISDLSQFILESQDGLVREGGLGAVFAIITIFLFLFSLRSTLVAAISIPLSVLGALVLMQFAGISLNIMTLGGLAVAVGRVVDDAIVVLENIYRHRALGEDRLTAVIQGPKEVARAITSSTLTTVLVFLPIGFVGGIVSQLFLPFALTVTFALLASLVVALTVVPVLAYLFINKVSLNVDEDGEPKNEREPTCSHVRVSLSMASGGRPRSVPSSNNRSSVTAPAAPVGTVTDSDPYRTAHRSASSTSAPARSAHTNAAHSRSPAPVVSTAFMGKPGACTSVPPTDAIAPSGPSVTITISTSSPSCVAASSVEPAPVSISASRRLTNSARARWRSRGGWPANARASSSPQVA